MNHPSVGVEPLRTELDHLLAEPIAAAQAREQSAFDAAAGQSGSVVLFGAGRLGRRTLGALRAVGVEPLAFADNSKSLWGTVIDGIPILSPSDAAHRFSRAATFVVTIWRAGGPHRYEQSRRQLQALGCKFVTPMMPLGWKYASAMLPHYCVDLPHKVLSEASNVRRAFDLLSDGRSRREYLAQLEFRLLANLDGLPHPDHEPQYLAGGIYERDAEEVIIDGGAYDGDTLRSMVAADYAFRDYIALEPDPANFTALEQCVAELPKAIRGRVTVLPIAAYSARTRMNVQESGSASAALVAATEANESGAVECVPLDEIVGDRRATFIKLDIEGAEPEAIVGARRIVARDRPMIAMCVYHRQDHLWSLPLLVDSIVSDYRYYLRPYNEEGWDLVCYAVPAERALAGHD